MAKDIPLHPPKSWFSPPESGIPVDKRITIEADGRVYGYIATWDTCHVGLAGCTRPPKGSPTDYEYAHQGETMTADEGLIATAVIGGGAGHAPMDMETAAVPSYYDNTGTQLMRVKYGEDQHGLWFAGALWPNVEDLQVEQIRASSISGDWRWHAAWRKTGDGGHDFAGACLVNIPGFPMRSSSSVGDRSGRPFALAASALTDDELIVSDGEVFDSINADIEGGDMSDCDGNCTDCTCSKADDEATTEEDDEIIAAAYAIMKKRKIKKNGPISADLGLVDQTVTPATLEERISAVEDAVSWMTSVVSDLEAESMIEKIVRDTASQMQ